MEELIGGGRARKGMYGKYLFFAEGRKAEKWVIYLGQSEKIAVLKTCFQLVF